MAYVSAETKARIAPKLRAIAKKYGLKATVAALPHRALVLNISGGKIDFITNHNETLAIHGHHSTVRDHISVNTYHYPSHFTGEALAFLTEAVAAINDGNHDNSDTQTDYFDVGWYTNINIGRWNKPYTLTA